MIGVVLSILKARFLLKQFLRRYEY